MKTFIKLLILLICVLQINNGFAAENIIGTWQGKLVVGPDSELTVQFIISQGADGSLTVILNSPDEGGIKNVKANSVVYDAGILKLDVAELSGSYEGVVGDGKIDGEWKQEGTSMPLTLKPYEKPTLSEEDKNKLLGEWHGQLTIPAGSLTVVFRFETTKDGEFVGFADSPDQGAFGIPVTDIEVSDGNVIVKVSSLRAEYKGKLSDHEIVGEFKQIGEPMPLTLKKGKYSASAGGLDLPKEAMDLLLGEWHGKLTIPTGSLTVVFRFEMTENNEFVGFHDSPDQGAKGMPITEANLSDGKLTLKMKGIFAEFSGQLSGDKLVGEWTQMGNSTPLSLVKGEYKAQVYKLSLSKEAMDLLSGKWNGKLGPLTLVFRFETSETGDFVAFIDSPNQGAKGIPVTEANFSEGELTLKVKAVNAEFKGQLSGDELAGDWTQGGMSNPLTLAKEKP